MKTKTFKSLLALAMAFAMLFTSIGFISNAAETDATLSVNSPVGLKNGNITVSVTASNILRVHSCGFTLSYDSTRFDLQSASSNYSNIGATIDTSTAGTVVFNYTNPTAGSATPTTTTVITGLVLNVILKIKGDVAQVGTSQLSIPSAYYNAYKTDNSTVEQKTINTSAGEILVSDGTAVPVTAITLSSYSLTLGIQQTKKVTVSYAPADATNKTAVWQSLHPNIATVNQSGEITGVSLGVAIIMVSAQGLTPVSLTVTVSNIETSVVLNETTKILPQSAVYQLKATVYPESATNKAVTWESSDLTVATVAQDGKVTTNPLPTGVDLAQTTITVRTVNGCVATCIIIVSRTAMLVPETIEITPKAYNDTIYLRVGETYNIEAVVNPIGSTWTGVTWTSSNLAVAGITTTTQTVLTNLISAISEGISIIRVTTTVGNLTATLKVVVLPQTKQAVSYHLNEQPLVAVKDNVNNLEVDLSQELFETGKNVYGENYVSYMFNQTLTKYSSICMTFDPDWIAQNTQYLTFGIGDISKMQLSGDILTAIKAANSVTIKLTRDYIFEIYLDGVLYNPQSSTNQIKYTIFYGALMQGANPDQLIIYKQTGSDQTIIPECNYRPATSTIEFWSTSLGKFVTAFNAKSFPDVLPGAAYSKQAEYLASRGIIVGIGSGDFAPLMNVKRADILIMIMRSYGIPNDTILSASFSDVPSNYYYAPYIATAKRMNLTNGTSVENNTFAPERNVTMQEMIVFVYRTIQLLGKLPSNNVASGISAYSDANEVFDYARTPIDAFLKAGVYAGENGKINATKMATRADVAILLYNILSIN